MKPLISLVAALTLSVAVAASGAAGPTASWDPARGILIQGATVVTMDIATL